MSVPRLGGCSWSLAGSRTSGCFAGSASGSMMPVGSRRSVNGHALRWSSQGPILLRTLGSESTHPLSSLGTKHLSSRHLLPRCLGSLESLSSYLMCLLGVAWSCLTPYTSQTISISRIHYGAKKYSVATVSQGIIWKRLCLSVRTDNLFTRMAPKPLRICRRLGG